MVKRQANSVVTECVGENTTSVDTSKSTLYVSLCIIYVYFITSVSLELY